MNLTCNELACIDAEIVSIGYNVTPQMISVVSDFMIARCVEAYSYQDNPISNFSEQIAGYFGIPYKLADAIQCAICHNPPIGLQRVTRSISWGDEVLYENPEYA